jgi:hypothetical protein
MISTMMRTSFAVTSVGCVVPATAWAEPGRTLKACGVAELDAQAVLADGVVAAAVWDGWAVWDGVAALDGDAVGVQVEVADRVADVVGVWPPAVLRPPVVEPPPVVVFPPVVEPPPVVVFPPVVEFPPVVVCCWVLPVEGVAPAEGVPVAEGVGLAVARVFSWVATDCAWVWRLAGSGR